MPKIYLVNYGIYSFGQPLKDILVLRLLKFSDLAKVIKTIL